MRACQGRRFRTKDTPGSSMVPQRTHKFGLLAHEVQCTWEPLCRGGRIPAHASESIRRHTQDLRVLPASLTGAVAGNCNCKNRKIGAKYSHPKEPRAPRGANVASRRRLRPSAVLAGGRILAQQRPTHSPRCSTRRLLERFHTRRQVQPARSNGPKDSVRNLLSRLASHNRARNRNRVQTTLRYANKDVGHVFPWRESWSRCR